MILVDSSVWIDYFKGTITPQTEMLDRLLGREPLAIGDLILTEVLQGFADGAVVAFVSVGDLGFRSASWLAAEPSSSSTTSSASTTCRLT